MTASSGHRENLWHSQSREEVLEMLHSSRNGLAAEDASKRLEEYGLNKLPEKSKRPEWKRFIKQFDNILIYVLLAAAVVTALFNHWIDTWVILAVVVINAIIGFIQEGKAEKALESIKKMLSLESTVYRDGEKHKIQAEEIVPGDIVSLSAGDKMPADMRILEAKNFKVEESPLTGESEAAEKNPEPVDGDVELGDRSSMAYSGTTAIYGNARAVVTATGEHTELGKINRMISETEEITTPLLRQVHKFGVKLAVIIVSLATALFLFGYFVQDYALDEMFMAVISLAVAAIPEGLPAIITITLAVGVQRMARRNAIIRKLPSVETLGAVSVICSDKTGTLTLNEMTAKLIVVDGELYEVEGEGYIPDGDIRRGDGKVDLESVGPLKKLLQTVWLCNEAEVRKDKNDWKMLGEPTEGALKTLGYKAGFKDFRPERLDEIPFDSEHKYMATLNQLDNGKIISIKGAPERLLDMCDNQLTKDGKKQLDKDAWLAKIDEVAEKGMRVLGAAYKIPPDESTALEKEDIREGSIFLGLIGIMDPPRKEAIRAVKACQEAGIEVKMVTGDHTITAMAIGRQLNIGGGKAAIDGRSMDTMDETELQKVVMENDVFARTSPEHKVRLVKAIRANNMIIAMTGDGVNDAPALKNADVGIAMGIKGTEVAKDTAEMVLADDNFASITNAVEEGRTVYDNLRKAILFILPTNGAESMVIIAAVLMGIAMPVTPAQILWVNMVTAVTLALALSFEPMEEDVMKNPPRDPDAPIIGGYFLFRIVYVSFVLGGAVVAVFLTLQNQYDMATARTVAVNSLVAGQLFYLLNCRGLRSHPFGRNFFRNKAVLIACVALIILQAVFTYAPFMHSIFITTSITVDLLLYPLLVGVGVFALVELEKWVARSRKTDVRQR